MRRCLLYFLAILFSVPSLVAQNRYLEPVFNQVQVTSTAYGRNFTVIAVPQTGRTMSQPLATDIYSPVGDTETKRPLVIYFPTGNFLPFPLNGSTSGTIKDSTCVDIATKLAKMGYVCAVADYRKGWNPVAPTQEPRVNTLINAAYRGVQDARTAVRFFKEFSDVYGIDTTKIILWGQGTGGYISLAAATLDRYSEVITTTNPEFKFIGSNQRPFVIERIPLPGGGFFYINSDIEGKNLGLVPPNADGTPNPGPPPTGDTLCLPNWVRHSSNFKLAINMGGALGDISWLDQNSVPILSVHAPYDPFAPYEDAVLFVPIPGGQLPVVQVQGSLLVQQKQNALGKLEDYKNLNPAFDPIGTAIKSRQNGLPTLFPVVGTTIPSDSSPWDFWAADNPNNASGLIGNPDMSADKARRYIDSIIGFLAPRICVGAELPCRDLVLTAVNDLSDKDVNLSIAPNPANGFVVITSDENKPIKAINVMDANGRQMRRINQVNTSNYRLNQEGLSNGLYLIQIQFDEGQITRKVIFK